MRFRPKLTDYLVPLALITSINSVGLLTITFLALYLQAWTLVLYFGLITIAFAIPAYFSLKKLIDLYIERKS